jgi:hypothetical protein
MTDTLDTAPDYPDTTSGGPQTPEEVPVVMRGPREDGARADSGGTPTSTFWGMADFTVNHGFARTLVFPANVIVRPDSQIAVSITELTGAGVPFLGSAIMNVDNVVPQQGRVIVRGDVHWDAPLRVRLNFVIVN